MAAAQPSPPRGGPLAGHTPGRRSKRICLCPKTNGPHQTPQGGGTGDRRSGPEATPQHPCLPHPPPKGGKGGKTGEGPRRQTEKSGHVHWERPSLVRHGLGPAQESTTTPHQSVEAEGRGRRHRRAQSLAGPALSLTSNRQPATFPRHQQASHLRRGRPTTRGGERLTRGTEPTGQLVHQKLFC